MADRPVNDLFVTAEVLHDPAGLEARLADRSTLVSDDGEVFHLGAPRRLGIHWTSEARCGRTSRYGLWRQVGGFREGSRLCHPCCVQAGIESRFVDVPS